MIYGEEYVNKGEKSKASKSKAASPKNAQDAHEAIRPADNGGTFRSPDDTELSGISTYTQLDPNSDPFLSQLNSNSTPIFLHSKRCEEVAVSAYLHAHACFCNASV
jgi:hypothetical protein